MSDFHSTQMHSRAELEILATYRVARPDTWSLQSPALLVVDVVESFVGPDAPVAEAQRECPTACGELAWQAIRQTKPILAAFRSRGLPIAFSTVDGTLLGRVQAGASALRSDAVVEPLAPRPGEFVFSKMKPSAFFGTPLIAWLFSRQVRQLVVVGGATSGCIRATVLDAFSYGFDVILPAGACFDRVQTSHAVTLTDMDIKYARVTTCDDVINKFGEGA